MRRQLIGLVHFLSWILNVKRITVAFNSSCISHDFQLRHLIYCSNEWCFGYILAHTKIYDRGIGFFTSITKWVPNHSSQISFSLESRHPSQCHCATSFANIFDSVWYNLRVILWSQTKASPNLITTWYCTAFYYVVINFFKRCLELEHIGIRVRNHSQYIFRRKAGVLIHFSAVIWMQIFWNLAENSTFGIF